MRAKKEHEKPEHNLGENDTPPWEGGFNDIQASHDGDKTGEPSKEVPAGWTLIVVVLDHDLVMGVYFRIVQEHLLLFLRSFALVPPEEISGRSQEILKTSKAQGLLDFSQRQEAPSGLDLGVIPEEHMNEAPSKTGVGSDKAEYIT